MTGFEPAAPTSLTWCANRTALHPDRTAEAVEFPENFGLQIYKIFLPEKHFPSFLCIYQYKLCIFIMAVGGACLVRGFSSFFLGSFYHDVLMHIFQIYNANDFVIIQYRQ